MCHGLGGGGQGFSNDSTKALVIKSVTMGGVKNCAKSFMDDPNEEIFK